MADIKFYRCSSEQFNSSTYEDKIKQTDGHIFFVTDEGKIYVSNGSATEPKDPVCFSLSEYVKDVEFDNENHSLKFTRADGEEVSVPIGMDDKTAAAIDTLKGLVDENGQLKIDEKLIKYNSSLDDSITVLNPVGGIVANTSVGALKGKTFSLLFDDLLFPTLYPSKTNPTITLALQTTGNNKYPNILEFGAVAPTLDNFKITTSRGQITLNNTKQNDYAGAEDTATRKLYLTNETTGLPEKLPTTGTSVSYYAETKFADGPTPLNSKGNTEGVDISAYTGGTYVKSTACSISLVYPIFANNTDITKFEKLPLQTEKTISALEFPAETAEKRATIKVKGTVNTTTGIKKLNTASGNYEVVGNWAAKGTQEIDINGNLVIYNIYSQNAESAQASGTFEITFS